MKLFLLERQEDFPADFDENEAFVIAAETSNAARKFAAATRGDESPETWLNIKCSKLTSLGEAHVRIKPGVVLRAFHGG